MRQLIGDFDFDLDPMQAGVARIANRYFERDFFSNSDSVQMLDIARRREMMFQAFWGDRGHLLDGIRLNHIRGCRNLGMSNHLGAVNLPGLGTGNPLQRHFLQITRGQIQQFSMQSPTPLIGGEVSSRFTFGLRRGCNHRLQVC